MAHQLSVLIVGDFDEKRSPLCPALMFLHYCLIFPYGDKDSFGGHEVVGVVAVCLVV